MHLELISVIVDEYDPAIDFFVERLGLERSAGSPVSTRTAFHVIYVMRALSARSRMGRTQIGAPSANRR